MWISILGAYDRHQVVGPTDNHVVGLFWAPINKLPATVPPQDGWLKWLASVY
jgi:hypothetical protein